mmetsp:Transcript_18465/g.25414  ORF Transcript_18465/g.25414 Transcript_18465/m.25414 type:complete len:482 (-) Transcript_18465:110-1555(-)|eukprot:CAMPEP_0185732338 /NCGR_PEP_ID=MMETSP1171-20130828/15830_1 /TAXON_ID=374046 /ORGANISM="Helicotheca tamensis, Strain CCMP826" /LENGTH=481 /DNA_ID=CAMNT_0028401797 /DNA_START=79 /DNA_END=1524 /DNA_ORIENTATION=+
MVRNADGVAAKAALADAIAGMAASLVSMVAFYPVDVMKTRTQVGHDEDKEDGTSKKKARALSFFRGLHLKMAHTILSSFTYFYLLSYVQSRHRSFALSRGRRRKGESSDDGMKEYRPKVRTRLMLAAVAAAANTLLTLPLDVMASRSQAGSSNGSRGDADRAQQQGQKEGESHDSLKSNSNTQSNVRLKRSLTSIVWDEIERETTWEEERLQTDDDTYKTAEEYEYEVGICHEDGEEEKKDPESPPQITDSTTMQLSMPRNDKIPQPMNDSHLRLPSQTTPSKKLKALRNILSLWSGLYPSLLLCSNPSIHHTVFDALKAYIIDNAQAKSKQDSSALSMWEAFLVGLVAKFAATIATYPLIRAKVVLMVSSSTNNNSSSPISYKKKQQMEEQGNENETKEDIQPKDADKKLSFPTEQPAQLTMTAVLRQFIRQDGIKGLYRGCRLQLLHTMLKSALLMMVRERIQKTTRNMIVLGGASGGT